jgi:multiple sugar transport system substrate-binding protein
MKKLIIFATTMALFIVLAAANLAGQVKISYIYWGSPAEDVAVQKALTDFGAANPGITAEPMYLAVTGTGTEYNAKMKAMAASDTLPDLGYFRPEEFDNYAKNGFFLDLTDLAKRDGMIKDYLPTTWLSNGGKIYGAYTAAECQVLYYNKNVLLDAGVPLPPNDYTKGWTWSQFVTNLKKITVDRNGKHPGDSGFDVKKVLQWGIRYELWTFMLYPTIWGNGGGFFSADGKQCLLDKPETIEAVQKLADLMNKDRVMPPTSSTTSMAAAQTQLLTGQLGFYVGGQWELLDFGKKSFPYGVGALPILKKPAQVYLSGANVIFSSTKHPEEAWKLQKWMMTPDATLGLYSEGLWMPTKSSWYTNPTDLAKWINNAVHPEGFKGAVVDSMKVAQLEPRLFNNAELITTYVTPALDSVWTGQATAKDALTKAADQIRKSGLLQGAYN